MGRAARRVADRLAARRRERGRDPYAGLPVDPEYGEPILPRWFVLAVLGLVAAAVVLGAIAFVGFGTGLIGADDVPVAERRPPPAGDLATGVGELTVEDSPTEEPSELCPAAEGVRVGGTDEEQARLADAIEAACTVGEDALAPLGQVGAEVRFAGFEATGVDATTDVAAEPPVVHVNARFAQQDARLIVPLLAHEAELVAAARAGEDVGAVDVALAARQRQHEVCGQVLDAPSRACEDAAELLADPDAPDRLRAAGFR